MRGQVRGRELGYDDRGRGAAVVLLHPFPFARNGWDGVVDVLSTRCRVVTVDARGFGESALNAVKGSSAQYAITDLADDVAGLLDALEIPRAAVMGLSMGGYTALAFAANYPSRLTALGLFDTRAAADTPDARASREVALSTIASRGAAAYLDTSLARMLSPGATPALRSRVRAAAQPRADALVAALEAMRDRPDRTAELNGITCATLVVCGANDQVTPPAEMRLMCKAIPNARYVELPGAGHLTHLEVSESFTHAVSSFLGDLPPP